MNANDLPARTGKAFSWIAWILALALLYWLFDDLLQAQFNPNQEVKSRVTASAVEVILERNRAGHYVANGAINNTEVVFLLDTGATQVAIPAGVADRIGLPEGQQVMVRTANGTAVAYRTRIAQLSLGDIVLNDVAATIVPGMGGEEILLGMSALKQVEFTQRGTTLTIRY